MNLPTAQTDRNPPVGDPTPDPSDPFPDLPAAATSPAATGPAANPSAPPSTEPVGTVTRYEYPTAAGDLCYTVVRTKTATGKDFRVEPVGVKPEDRVPYRLPELRDGSDPVVIPEGERKVDALRAMGVTATCNPGGAGKWRDQYSECLRGRIVIVFRDNDDAGRRHAEQVCQSLYGIAAEVRVVSPPDYLKVKGDVVDVLARPDGVAEVRRLLAEAKPWTPSQTAQDAPGRANVKPAGANASKAAKAGSNGAGSQAAWDRVRELIRERRSCRDELEGNGVPVGKDGKFSAPWREDADPSVQIYPDGRFYDFGGDHRSGDVIDLVAHFRNISVGEAVVQLAREYGIELPHGEVPWIVSAAYRAASSAAEASAAGGGAGEPPDYGDIPAPSEPDEPKTAANDGRPSITAGAADLAEVVDQATAALSAANDPPKMLRYGGQTVTIEQEGAEATIVPMNEHRMREALARVARWYTIGQKGTERDAYTPMAIAQVVLSSGMPQLPKLTRLVRSPILAPSGRIVDQPGYDAETATWRVPGVQMSAVPMAPTTAEVAAARELLYEWVVNFPFDGDPDRANLLALALLPYVRDVITGPTPLHVIEKPTPGTGATRLLGVIAYLASGTDPYMMVEGRDDDEWRKRITSTLLLTPAFVVLDNLRRRLDSAALSSVLTSTRWEDRRLGFSENIRLDVTCAWVATGNNPAVSSEIARRIVSIRMDAKVEKPWERPDSEFLHPDLLGWTIDNRGRLLAAVFTLLRAWVAAGRPKGRESIGSYESYCAVLGGILDSAGIPGFLANRGQFYDRADVETTHWTAFVGAWWDKFKSSPVGIKQLWEMINAEGSEVEAPFDLGSGSEKSQRTRFGDKLKGAKDRVYSIDDHGTQKAVRIEAAGTRQRLAQYALVADTQDRIVF